MSGARGAWRVARPLLFALDPERAHRLALNALRVRGHIPAPPLPGEPVELMGLRFPNRVGLAAGFDKNAECVDGLWSLGFGFVEVGTVTPRAQPGRERPRLFRLPAQHALLNSLGFPNEGVHAVVERLRRRRHAGGVLGVNIGKNADTPLDGAVADYIACLRAVQPVADYVAVNISSPNTESLRELHRPEHLVPLLASLVEARAADAGAAGRAPPLLLKISPDLSSAMLEAVAMVVLRTGFDGVIAVNTRALNPAINARHWKAGGLSGEPLREKALAVVRTLREALGPEVAIIGLGGIASGSDARAMRAAGADLVQVYTGLVYAGPRLVHDCVGALESQPGP